MARVGAWFKYGGLGCLGVVALLLATVLVVSGLAFVTARPEQVEDRVLMPEIPAEVAGTGLPGGRIKLEIQEAELRIEPAAHGERLRIEARYDVNAFSLEEQLEPGTEGDDTWLYRATFGRAAGSGAFSGLLSLARGSTARVHVYLPADVPIDLVLNMEEGGAVVRLGGLWLRTAEIRFDSGGFELSVDEPLREPMESLLIRTAKGGALLNRLGNASPRRLDVDYHMGGIDMDLGGRWLADAEINISGGFGGGAVHLPSGVILEGLARGRVEARGNPELKPPTLSFSVSTRMGKLEFSD